MNFNKERFIHFAQYDLTINKAFYRNFSLFTCLTLISLTVLFFMGRYFIWQGLVVQGADGGNFLTTDPSDVLHYQNMSLAANCIFVFLEIMMSIFAGCWAHNLRTKQGRINELTLPATNLEKFVWHVGLMIIGGGLLCLLSLLLADGVNALLTMAVYGYENGIPSLAVAVGKTCDTSAFADQLNLAVHVNSTGGITTNVNEYEITISILKALGLANLTSIFLNTMIFMFGNALKYKYNIILTYVILQAIGTVVGIAGAIIFALQLSWLDAYWPQYFGDMAFLQRVPTWIYIWSAINILLSAFFVWKSYQLYKKAQITSSFNK